MRRRPHRSPRRPAGHDARPNRKKAATPKGMRSSQRAKPKSAAMAATAVAKISRNIWSSACATFSNSVTLRGKAAGGAGVLAAGASMAKAS
ncbi:Uncharacterised protein [Bordetella pertussis]|nr:Uncharacterised protein [Bordetella pertussis]